MTREKAVLAYSGGLDTTVAIKWLQEKYDLDVIAAIVDVGQPENLMEVQRKALTIGAMSCLVIDAQREFADDYIAPAIQANALYERKYPLPTALARPLIAKKLVEVAREHKAAAIAHGCTGKGNDQVRFDVTIGALAPDLRIIAPQREWGMNREQEIDYARERGIEVSVTKSSPYSIDENMYGRSIEAGVLEDPWVEPPPDVWSWTSEVANAPENAEHLELTFANGLPTVLNDAQLSLPEIIKELNEIAGRHGIGRVDTIEDRVTGIKSRELYECPAASVLLAAHAELESLVFPRELIRFKYQVEDAFADQVYNGLWFAPLRQALTAFVRESQGAVRGTVRLKLHKGNCIVVGRRSDLSIYDFDLATYDQSDKFSHQSAEGFIELFGLSTRIWAKRHRGVS
jgi:argininosuccinate synthase